MQSPQRVHFGRAPHVVYRSTSYDFWCAVLRSPIRIDDDGSFARKTFENARLNGADDRGDGLGIIMRRQANQDIHFAYIHELAKKLICQKRLFPQLSLQAKLELQVSVCRDERQFFGSDPP